MEIIPVDWYIKSPIDFEHKQYVLFSYLQRVDNDFHKKTLSPHLLHLEKLHNELINFDLSYNELRFGIERSRYVFFSNDDKTYDNESIIIEIKDIVEFSIPQIENRIKLGYLILKRHNQVLF